MKTKVTQTSIDAYYSLHLTEQQKMVLSAFERTGDNCIADIANFLGWERSTVAGRMNELKHMGCLIFVCKRKSSTTGITSEFYRVKETKTTLF